MHKVGTVQLPQKWEYGVQVYGEHDFVKTEQLTQQLNEAGEQGWELVGWKEYEVMRLRKYTMVFKRPARVQE